MRPAPALHLGDVTSVPSYSHPRLRTDKRVDPTSTVRPCPVSPCPKHAWVSRTGTLPRPLPVTRSGRSGLLHGIAHPASTPQNRHRTAKTPPWIVLGRAGNLCIQSDVLVERVTGIEPAPLRRQRFCRFFPDFLRTWRDSALFTLGCHESFFEQMTAFLPTTSPMALFTQSCDQ